MLKTADEVIATQCFSGIFGSQHSDGRRNDIRFVLPPKPSNFGQGYLAYVFPSYFLTTLDTVTPPIALHGGVKCVR